MVASSRSSSSLHKQSFSPCCGCFCSCCCCCCNVLRFRTSTIAALDFSSILAQSPFFLVESAAPPSPDDEAVVEVAAAEVGVAEWQETGHELPAASDDVTTVLGS